VVVKDFSSFLLIIPQLTTRKALMKRELAKTLKSGQTPEVAICG
jgi:hypothetical protein